MDSHGPVIPAPLTSPMPLDSRCPVIPAFAGMTGHLGYESDLLSAMEAMDDTGLSFKRHPIPEWDGIWLSPSNPEFDMAGGGITILESRTTDANGEKVAAFTSGHIKFRQSLLVRAEDANRLATYDRLTSEVRVGAFAGTTGEHRLLEIVGYVDYEGILVLGARVETPDGTLTADGSANYVITAAGESPQLKGPPPHRPSHRRSASNSVSRQHWGRVGTTGCAPQRRHRRDSKGGSRKPWRQLSIQLTRCFGSG